ncbi:hypothetical protein OG738_08990 [Amycolatopsis sp. NBC_01488]|uniref:hypothetical protein n=1 Tax=Amycolatopsis sp. NBC_01488 TaxID=2903563 RepID=UPI002E281995|nr:hypothetical protein [Amycolatopsis sp. NBC_01488]
MPSSEAHPHAFAPASSEARPTAFAPPSSEARPTAFFARPNVARQSVSAGQGRTAGKSAHARGRAPRPWAAALQRPAAKILVAGGLTLAGWLLTGALSGSTAAAAEPTACPHVAASTVEHTGLLGHHRTSHREAGAPTCAPQPDAAAGATKTDDTAADTTAKQSTKDTQTTEEPATPSSGSLAAPTEPATKTTASGGGLLNGLVGTVTSVTKPITAPATQATSSDSGLLGGLVGGVLNVVGGTLNTVTTTVSGTLNTVGAVTDTLSHTVLAPLTQPPAGNPDAPVLLPLDDILAPVLGSSNSGGVTVTVPGVVGDTLTPVTTTAVAPETAPAETPATTTSTTASRVATVHLVEVQNTLRAQQEQPRDSGVHARNGGGDSTPGLPGGSSAPSAPAPTAAPGHDGPGGVRHPFAVHTDDVTTTQLKLIGASRDHEVDGAGREAALPTTSPD